MSGQVEKEYSASQLFHNVRVFFDPTTLTAPSHQPRLKSSQVVLRNSKLAMTLLGPRLAI